MHACDFQPDDRDHPLYRSLRNYWHPVAYADEVGAAPQRVTLLGEHIALARVSGPLAALADRCAHRGASLSLGRIAEDSFECPYHAWRYDRNGHCVRIPSRNELTGVPNARVASYRTIECAGVVWLCLAGAARFPVPDFP